MARIDVEYRFHAPILPPGAVGVNRGKRAPPEIRYTGGMDEKPATRRSILAVWKWPSWAWYVVVVLMLVGYPLSMGPYAWLVEHEYLSPPVEMALGYFFMPIRLLVIIVPPLEAPYAWYLRLWMPINAG